VWQTCHSNMICSQTSYTAIPVPVCLGPEENLNGNPSYSKVAGYRIRTLTLVHMDVPRTVVLKRATGYRICKRFNNFANRIFMPNLLWYFMVSSPPKSCDPVRLKRQYHEIFDPWVFSSYRTIPPRPAVSTRPLKHF
jgi:hypothetical protein